MFSPRQLLQPPVAFSLSGRAHTSRTPWGMKLKRRLIGRDACHQIGRLVTGAPRPLPLVHRRKQERRSRRRSRSSLTAAGRSHRCRRPLYADLVLRTSRRSRESPPQAVSGTGRCDLGAMKWALVRRSGSKGGTAAPPQASSLSPLPAGSRASTGACLSFSRALMAAFGRKREQTTKRCGQERRARVLQRLLRRCAQLPGSMLVVLTGRRRVLGIAGPGAPVLGARSALKRSAGTGCTPAPWITRTRWGTVHGHGRTGGGGVVVAGLGVR